MQVRSIAIAVLVSVAAAATSGCGRGDGTSSAATPTPTRTSDTAPWRVVAEQRVDRAANTPAYVSAAARGDLLVTATTVAGPATRPASSIVARVSPGSGAVRSTLVPRSVVGVVRPPNGPTRLISLKATPDGRADELAVSDLSADGLAMSRAEPIPTQLPSIGAVAFAQNPAGDCVLAWSELRVGTGGDPVEDDIARIRVATGKWGVFGAQQILRETRGQAVQAGSFAVAVAVNGHGQAAVVSDGGTNGVAVWIGRVRAGSFDPPVAVPVRELVGPLRVAITDRDRVVLAWRNSNGDAMDIHGAVTVHAATIAPGSSQASPVQRVDRGPEYYPSSSEFDLIAVPGGRVTLAFSAPRSGDPAADEPRNAAFVTTANRTGRFGPLQELSHEGSVGGLAVRADGTEIVTLTRGAGSGSSTSSIQARIRAAGSAQFGPLESIAEIANAGDQPVTSQPAYVGGPPPDAPIPSFDPSTGAPMIAYTLAARGSQPGTIVVVSRDRP